jgi:hypothetical protein
MTQHWNPDREIARVKRTWPAGATAGLALVAAACVGVVATLYLVAGPSDVFENDSAIDWDKAPGFPHGD